VTTATFCTLEKDNSHLSRHCRRGETDALDNPDYRDYMLEQKAKGHEIAFHGYSQISNKREQFIRGLEVYKDIFGEYPFTYIEHGGIPIHHSHGKCKKERLDWFGGKEDSEYYVKDIIRDKISCIWSKFELLDGPEEWRGSDDNLTPKRDSDLFYKEDGILFFKRWRLYNLDRMTVALNSADDTTFIGYTHFGFDGHAESNELEDWRTKASCKSASNKIRKIIGTARFENRTVKQHVVENNL